MNGRLLRTIPAAPVSTNTGATGIAHREQSEFAIHGPWQRLEGLVYHKWAGTNRYGEGVARVAKPEPGAAHLQLQRELTPRDDPRVKHPDLNPLPVLRSSKATHLNLPGGPDHLSVLPPPIL